MTNPMLEKVARAIGKAHGVEWTDKYVTYSSHPNEKLTTAELQYALARAALEALLEPDEGVVEATAGAIGYQLSCDYDVDLEDADLEGLARSAVEAVIQSILKGDERG